MQLFVKTLQGRTFTVNTTDDSGSQLTVIQIKRRLQQDYPDLAGMQVVLIHAGRALPDEQTMVDLGIMRESVVHIVVRPTAEAPAAPTPPPAVSNFLQRRIEVDRHDVLKNIMVYCSHGRRCARITEDGPGRVHDCKLKLRCSACGNDGAITAPDDRELITFCTTIEELNSSMTTRTPIRGTTCLACDRSDTGVIWISCTDCKSCSHSGENCILQQMRKVEPGETCAVCACGPGDEERKVERFVQFDPCGCNVCLLCFIDAARVVIRGGRGRGEIALSPVTRQASLKCPMTCANSFLHDIHHYKILDSVDYLRMKDWVLPDQESSAGASSGLISQIQNILTEGFGTKCPVCGAMGQKDSACVHVSCQNRHPYCYWCEKRRDGQGDPAQRCGGNSQYTGCPQYIQGQPLANGMTLSNDPFVATQEVSVLKVTGWLRELYDEDPAAFEQVLQARPQLLQDVLEHDGRDSNGRQQHPPIPGVTITLRDIRAWPRNGYQRNGNQWKMPSGVRTRPTS